MGDTPKTSENKALVNFENINVRYGDVHVLEDVTCAFRAGETTALIGPNGSGKTSLLLSLIHI